MPLDLTVNKAYLRNIQIYENEKQFYFIGSHSINKTLLIFTFNKVKYFADKTPSYKLKNLIIEHKNEYDKKSFNELNEALASDSSTQLRFVGEAKAIFGFVKFYFGNVKLTWVKKG